ncbi:MAG: cytidine deaminase [Bacteroidales bacterium]|nr:cytidine deaminase [Bacteroidales bacterium]
MNKNNVEIRINIEEYESLSGLSQEDRDLIEAAREAAGNAYAPYSEFRVGAAVLLENGEVFTGNNQENAAYPDGLCAERVAMFAANASKPDQGIMTIAVAARIKDEFLSEPVYPCGSCRQALLESENRFHQNIRVLMYGTNKIQVAASIRDLLPLSFDSSFLKKS